MEGQLSFASLDFAGKSMSQKSRSSIISSEGPLSSSTPAVQLEPREGVKLPQAAARDLHRYRLSWVRSGHQGSAK